MPAPTLLSMAQRACARNLHGIQDVADIPYELVLPILKKIDNPQQLRNIEIASPHIADSDAELWKAFIARDIPQWESKIVEPKNPRSWWKVYRKLIKEEQRANEEQEEQLRATMMGLSQQREANQATIVRKVIPEQSRSKAFVDGVPNPHSNSWGQPKQPSLQSAKRGKDILNAIRTQSSKASKQRAAAIKAQPARVFIPNAKTQIAKAPMGMVRDHAKPAPMPAMKQARASSGDGASASAPNIFVRRTVQTVQDRALKSALSTEQAKKEDRLRALTGFAPKSGSAASARVLPPPTSTPRNSAAQPARTQSPQTAVGPAALNRPAAARDVIAKTQNSLSRSPAPTIASKRPAPTSVFIPTKRKRI